MNKNVLQLVNKMESISLKEMDDVSLMKRTDTKFVIHENKLLSVLDLIKQQYRVLEIDKNRLMTYSSLYFDTKLNKFYNDHHNGRTNRTKIKLHAVAK